MDNTSIILTLSTSKLHFILSIEECWPFIESSAWKHSKWSKEFQQTSASLAKITYHRSLRRCLRCSLKMIWQAILATLARVSFFISVRVAHQTDPRLAANTAVFHDSMRDLGQPMEIMVTLKANSARQVFKDLTRSLLPIKHHLLKSQGAPHSPVSNQFSRARHWVKQVERDYLPQNPDLL